MLGYEAFFWIFHRNFRLIDDRVQIIVVGGFRIVGLVAFARSALISVINPPIFGT